MTTRGAASAFFVNGTNRAMFRFTMMNHLCSDLPTVMDTTRPPDRIRQDVTRSPGGVSTLFLTNCIGCHSGMDPMAQAFAYYNFSYPAARSARPHADRPDRLHGRPGAAEVPHQQHQFPARLLHAGRQLEQPLAHRARTRCWAGARSLPGAGNGAKSLGQELESSAAFATCQVTRVFKDGVLRAPATSNNQGPSDATRRSTRWSLVPNGNYSLRQVFAQSRRLLHGELSMKATRIL